MIDTETETDISFEYQTVGDTIRIASRKKNGVRIHFTYDDKGNVIETKNDDGSIIHTIEYDDTNRMTKRTHYSKNDLGIYIDIIHTYSYDNPGEYIKTWFEKVGDSLVKKEYSKYSFDENIEGIYRKDPINKVLDDDILGFPFLHITLAINYGSVISVPKPKYFYDNDGYLVKYDKNGQNFGDDITIFIYK